MAETECRMDVERSNFSSPNTDEGLHERFSAFLNTVNLDDHWPLEGEYDMHICLKCLTNVVGLSKYLLHKLRECPKLSLVQPKIPMPSRKPEIEAKLAVEIVSTSALDEQHQQPIKSTGINPGTSDQTVELKCQSETIVDDDDDGGDNDNFSKNGDTRDNKSGILSSSKKRKKRTVYKLPKPFLTPQKVKPFSCGPCGLTCTSRTSLVYHLASPEHWRTSSKHPGHRHLILTYSDELAPLAPYKCSICPFYFNKLEDLANHCVKEGEAHKKKLGQYRKLLCTKCNFRCWTIEELLNHFDGAVHKRKSPQNPIVVSGTDDFFCTRCNWTCKRQHALLFHIKLKHAGEIHCKECQITFDEEEELNHHILETEHEKSLFSCALCQFVGRSKLNFQDHLKRGHFKYEPKRVGGVKRKAETSIENPGNKSENGSYANIVQQFMKAVDKVPQHAILQIQKIETAEDAASAGQKGKRSPGPLTFVKFDGNRNSENREPFVIFVVDSAKECGGDRKSKIVDSKVVCASLKHSEQETLSGTPQKQEVASNLCRHCDQKLDNQKALKMHLKTLHPEKLFHCEPCFATFCSKAKLESHAKGRLHACNMKDVHDIKKGYLKPTTEFSCKYCKFRTATKAGILFHEVMHAPNLNQVSVSTKLKADVSEKNEPKKALSKGNPPCVTKAEKENDEDLSIGLSNKNIFINHQNAEDDIYVHVIGDTNEVEVVTSKDAEQDNGLLETGGNPQDGMLGPITNKDICHPANNDIGEDESPIVNAERDTSHKSVTSRKLYGCPICQEPLTATKLRLHLIGHTGEQLFTCSICNASYSRKASLVSHERDQHEAKKYHCLKCSFRTNRKVKFNEHLTIHDGDNRMKEFACETCGAKFYTSSAVRTHMLIHTANKGRTIHCTFKGCMKSFRYLSEMLYHKRVHSREVSYLCELCGFATKSQQLLRKHERSHDDVKKFKCKYCSYAATHSYHLNRHMRIHDQAKPYSCPHCPFTCNSLENLRKHILNSKKHSGLKVYLCRHCDFGCNVADEMKMHTIRKHTEIAQQYDEDNPAFASLVAGIFKPESYSRVSSEQPVPYIPVKENQKQTKRMRSAPAREKPKAELAVSNSGDDIDWSHKQEAETTENNPTQEIEVDIAVDNLVEMTKWELEVPGILVNSATIESNDTSNSKCPKAILNENELHYQLFDDTDINFAKEELVSMDVQEVTIWAAADL